MPYDALSNADASSVEMMKLPQPGESQDKHIVYATNKLATSMNNDGQVSISPEQSYAMTLQFTEDISTGAIGKTGALSFEKGSDYHWLTLAEDKIIDENSLNYHQLLWEYGSEIIEAKYQEQGGLNMTLEQSLLERMQEWFIKGGGKLNFVSPTVNEDDKSGYILVADEEIINGATVVSMPMKLIMCKQTARNVLIQKKGKYLGEELSKAFDKNEVWGLTIFLLHEYFKEAAGDGSKWGPYIRSLRMRFLSTDIIKEMAGTGANQLMRQWFRSCEDFMWWTTGLEGPCTPTSGICRLRPNDKNSGDNRFNMHHIRWAYWIVKQNAVRVKHSTTGLTFLALVPYFNLMDKTATTFIESSVADHSVTFDIDGSVSIHAANTYEIGEQIGVHPGNFTDSEYFLRYFDVPSAVNDNNHIKMSLPGAIPEGSKFHYCVKGTQRQQRKNECMGSYKSEALFWKSKVLSQWRKTMNLPPRMQELRMWAMRLHIFGDEKEMELLSNANKVIAGLPISVDDMPAEEQLMLLGIASTNYEASLMASGAATTQSPQLYSAPDPAEDPEARRFMENLAELALQASTVISTGNVMLNATQVVLNQTRDFFLHGVLPSAGLDVLDEFLLKKIGMIAHCGYEHNMRLLDGNVTEELMCAMRVHLMNESEIHFFCPRDARPWEDNCHEVQFSNFTAISRGNELLVIDALNSSIHTLLSSYPTHMSVDEQLLQTYAGVGNSLLYNTIRMRLREKLLLHHTSQYLDSYKAQVLNASCDVPFQMELKLQER